MAKEVKEKSRPGTLLEAIAELNKKHGEGTIVSFSNSRQLDMEVISTGSLSLDDALGVGGLPRGRIIEIYGMESTGKSTIALQVAAEVQKAGGTVAIVDAEHAMDRAYATRIGIDVDSLLINQPDNAEQGLEVVETLVSSNEVDLIIVDSVAALVPKAELDGEMGQSQPGLHARLMNQALRKLTPIVGTTKTVVIFINQIRQKIGVMFGNPETTTGGLGLKFAASIRLEVRAGDKLFRKEGEKEQYGNKLKIKTVKNKVAPPGQVAEVTVIFGKGIDIVADVLETALRFDIITKHGSWFKYQNENLAQGFEGTRDFLEINEGIYEQIKTQVKEAMRK